MTTNFVLPPDFANAPVTALFDAELPDAVKVTLFQLHALAWSSGGDRTPAMTKSEFCGVRGIDKRTWDRHLDQLIKDGFVVLKRVEGSWRYTIHPQKTTTKMSQVSPQNQRTTTVMSRVSPQNQKTTTDLSRVSPQNPKTTTDLSRVSPQNQKTTTDLSRVSPQNPKTTTDLSRVLNHACHVVDSLKHEHELKQQHGHAEKFLIDEIVEKVFIPNGGAAGESVKTVTELVETYGAETCRRHLSYFDRRCEIAAQSKRGLTNPVGLFVKSVQQGWSPPPEVKQMAPVPVQSKWYTEEEAELFVR